MNQQNQIFQITNEIEKQIEQAAEMISQANNILFYTGSGISVESGVKSFQDPFYEKLGNKLGLAMFGIPFGWNNIPSISWHFFKTRFLKEIITAQPNPAHLAISDLLTIGNKNVKVITQIIDGLHQRGGIPDERISELHGSACKFRCIQNGHPIEIDLTHGLPTETIKCTECKSKIRPDCTLFSEGVPQEAFTLSDRWINECLWLLLEVQGKYFLLVMVLITL